MIRLGVKKLHPDAKLPKMGRAGDAAFDIYSVEEVMLLPGNPKIINCGIACEIPDGYKIMIRGRSGLALRGIWTHVGTVDSNFKGGLGPILTNCTKEVYCVKKGDRVGQISVEEVIPTKFEEVFELSESVRGSDGFGSSGR